MSALTTWVLIGGGMFFLASFWVMYLIKVVANDEDLQERIRRIRRQREEERRALEDKLRARRQQQDEMQDGVAEKIMELGGVPPPGSMPAAPDGEATEA